MERDELRAWLRLCLAPGVGNDTARRLLGAFGDPAAIFNASEAALLSLVSVAQARALIAQPPDLEAAVDRTLAWCAAGPARSVVTLADSGYPARLLSIADPPLMLYLHGPTTAAPDELASRRLAILGRAALAIVGSRNPTAQGVIHARGFATALAQSGLVIVSGLALGIDAAAHQGALDGGCVTLALIGTGADVVYPKRNAALAQAIIEHGMVISEYPLGTPPLRENFPRRNRLISGLSLGTLVVEAAVESGSLITARMALEQGREVFAIPGSIQSPQSRGCHALIRQGAKLVECAQDVLEDLRTQGGLFATPAGTPMEPGPQTAHDEDELLRAMAHDPVSLDALQARTGLPASRLQARLLELELDGQVARLPGGLFQRTSLA